MEVSIKMAVKFIHETNGKIFSVVFTKRNSTETREMVCRTGVKAKLAEDPKKPPPNFKANALIGVYDLRALDKDGEKGAYRSIPIEGIKKIKIDGEWYDVIH